MASLAFFSGTLLHPLPYGSTRLITSSVPCSFCCCSSRSRKLLQVATRSSVPDRVAVEMEEDIDGLVKFLYDDLPHLFDDQGVDRSMYDEAVEFIDPITKYDDIDGYMFNIGLLKKLFQPDFQLHSVKKTGSYELTTRWTMVMKFSVLPWKPDVVFTGTSIMGINPINNKFCKHVDIWDSIENNDYFSVEGLLDFLKQLRYYKTPDLSTPKYQVLKRRLNYEVRKYSSFLVAESQGDKLSGSGGFDAVTGYIFGNNKSSEKIPMATPVFTQTADISGDSANVFIQVVLPMDKELDKLPSPVTESVDLKRVEGITMAAIKFSGRPTEDVVKDKEKQLRASLINDGLKPKEGCLLARYNDPRTKSFIMRNEVMIELDDFVLV